MNEWFETAKRAPTAADADDQGNVLWRWAEPNLMPSIAFWQFSAGAKLPTYWLPIPPLPVKRDAVVEARQRLFSVARISMEQVDATEALIVAIVAKERER